MKKIGIITIIDYTNYGNRLQNYAVQEVLKSLECNVETLIYERKKENINNIKLVDLIKKIRKITIKKIIESLVARIIKRSLIKPLESKIDKFKQFTQKHILETRFVILDDFEVEEVNQFDYFIVGSDQVWNPIFRKGSSIDFLTFAQKNKRIAYAPSFGVSSIPSEYVKIYSDWISEIEYLSVREEAGAKIIKQLTGRDAIVLVDPTLMLTRKKWLSIATAALNKPKQKYLLTYFMGEVSKDRRKKIKSVAIKNNLKIVNLCSIKDKSRYDADPGEFIDYINSASIFFTDSFHGTVFSILLEKPFVIFDREEKTPSMNSRIDTLLAKFKLESRKADNINLNSGIFEVDYSQVPFILEAERKKTIAYLKNALDLMA